MRGRTRVVAVIFFFFFFTGKKTFEDNLHATSYIYFSLERTRSIKYRSINNNILRIIQHDAEVN